MATKTATKTAPVNPVEAPIVLPTRQASRKDVLEQLSKHGYTGPTSFTATVLRGVVAWIAAGAPKDDVAGVPNGVLVAVHPDLKPVREVRAPRVSAYGAGYRQAIQDVAALGSDLQAIRAFVS